MTSIKLFLFPDTLAGTTTALKVISEVAITTTPIVYWSFLPNSDNVLIISKLMGFTWKTAPVQGTTAGGECN